MKLKFLCFSLIVLFPGFSYSADEETLCEAEIRLLQKDAYSNKAGRNFPALPPHSSVQIRINCLREEVAVINRENYGTHPDHVDAEGATFLKLVYSDKQGLSLEEARVFVTFLNSLSCHGVSPFLSLELLQEKLTPGFNYKKFFNELPGKLRKKLEAHKQEEALKVFDEKFKKEEPWKVFEEVYKKIEPSAWEKIFSESWVELSKELLPELEDGLHVCNNEARLVMDAWFEYKSGADKNLWREDTWFQSRCKKPLLFLNPLDSLNKL